MKTILATALVSVGCAKAPCGHGGPFRASEVRFVGHRMSHPKSGNIPAQTIQSLLELIAKGGKSVEFDVSTSKDGVLIAFHDRDMCDMTGKNILVEDTDFRSMPKIKGGHDVPLIKDVVGILEEANSISYVIVDIKNVSPAAFDDFFGLVQSLRQRKTVVIQMSETRRNISRLPMYCRRFRELGLDIGRNYSRGSLCGRWGSQ